MADMQQGATHVNEGHRSPYVETPPPTGWVGWIAFAGMMLILVGSFHAVQGLVAIFRDEVLLVADSGLLIGIDYTAWGWTHILWGGLSILVGACLLAGQMWARVIAVIVAVISAIVNVMFLPAYPVWSVLMIAVDILVIWAITVHGSEMKTV